MGKYPPEDPIPINVKSSNIWDDVPYKRDIREVVKQLKNGRAGRASKIQAEDIKSWLRGMIDKDENDTEGAGDLWRGFVRLIQLIWEHGSILQQMRWLI